MDVRKIPCYPTGHHFPLLCLLLLCSFLLYPPQFSSTSSHLNGSSPLLCRREDELALLQFQSSFTIDTADGLFPNACSYSGQLPYEKTASWVEGTSGCCSWDGVTCDPSTGHVVGLDLSCGLLQGTLGTNSSLFTLTHLQSLNLAFNNLYASTISPPTSQVP
ncbi:hypothetical protein Dimus_012563 [Dionaea muscipula]